jgi:PAS domain S-box-containing protein/diguanylate cyclase (GGDEF)-like protein
MDERWGQGEDEKLARLAAFPEQNPNPVLGIDERGVAYANPAALALFPDLRERGEDHALTSGIRRVAAELGDSSAATGEVAVGGDYYYLDVQAVPGTGGLHVYVTDITKHRESRRALLKSWERLYNLVEHAADALFVHDQEGRIKEVNRSACERLGYSREELLALSIQDVEYDLNLDELSTLWKGLSPDRPVTIDGSYRCKDGSVFPVELRLVVFEDDRSPLILALARDATRRLEAQRLLAESERRFRQLFDRSAEAIFLHDSQGRLVDCNSEACISLGYEREELLSLSVEDFVVDLLSEEERSLRDETPWKKAIRIGPGVQDSFHKNEHRRKDGSTFPVEVAIGALDYGNYGDERLVLASARDISGRRRIEEELSHRNHHDPQTGLPNRALLYSRLQEAVLHAGRGGRGVAVMFLRLGGLDRARERLGYRAGDRMLSVAARRIMGCLAPEDIVGRMGGDDLAVIAESAGDGEQAIQTTLEILEDLREPLPLDDAEFQADATIGVASSPDPGGEDGHDPLDSAYEAMCGARLRGDLYGIHY